MVMNKHKGVELSVTVKLLTEMALYDWVTYMDA